MIVLENKNYNLYEIKGQDMFDCTSLKRFAWINRVEYKLDKSEYIPSTLNELEKKIEEVNNFFEKKKMKKGWFLILKEDDNF